MCARLNGPVTRYDGIAEWYDGWVGIHPMDENDYLEVHGSKAVPCQPSNRTAKASATAFTWCGTSAGSESRA